VADKCDDVFRARAREMLRDLLAGMETNEREGVLEALALDLQAQANGDISIEARLTKLEAQIKRLIALNPPPAP